MKNNKPTPAEINTFFGKAYTSYSKEDQRRSYEYINYEQAIKKAIDRVRKQALLGTDTSRIIKR